MNITIDTTTKTITINGQVNGKEFIDEIKKLGLDLKEYSFITKVESYPYYPFIQPHIIYDTNPFEQREFHISTAEGIISTVN